MNRRGFLVAAGAGVLLPGVAKADLFLNEIAGFGIISDLPFTDLTTGKTASANSALVAAGGAIDDVIALSGANYWQGGSVSGVNSWIAVDLATAFAVTRLRIWNDTGGAYITGFRVEYSDTGAWGGEQATALTDTMAQGTGTGAEDYQEFSWPASNSHRYWRIFVTGCNNGRANNPLVIEFEFSL